ncbi:MAG: metallophosphoesterase family protein [Gemmataceae bacterium]|nr:metallophosphoesterase family protein [Gemmataceae bacterium]
MNHRTDRRAFLRAAGAVVGGLTLFPETADGRQKGKNAANGGYVLPSNLAMYNALSLVFGRAGDRAITANLFAQDKLEAVVEYGTQPNKYSSRTPPVTLATGQPLEMAINDLRPGTRYYYRLLSRKPGESAFHARPECQFHTRRPVGSSFTFCVQGDSHPERPQMSEPNLYARTLQHAAGCRPDLYFCMGDDFSVDKVRTVSADSLAAPYLLQRPFLSLVAQFASLYLVNGNHEQASLFNYNQTDERHEVAVGVQTARNRFFPMPATDGIYTGDTKELKGIGLLRDYFAWTWGDALFVVLDNYWHSQAIVDSGFKGGGNKKATDDKKNRDWWGITLGDEQYHWFRKTLEGSRARYKFVFAHHVMGTGRGGVEASENYEWGGKSKGKSTAGEFKKHRPGWELPVHQLMAKHGVSIFFQGHDHLYARQIRDGVIYQEVPLPADPTYTAFNDDAYTSGTKLANSGYLRVSVSPEEAKVDYVRSWLPKDETSSQKTGDIAHSYSVKPRT